MERRIDEAVERHADEVVRDASMKGIERRIDAAVEFCRLATETKTER